jgi:hypothetical protein
VIAPVEAAVRITCTGRSTKISGVGVGVGAAEGEPVCAVAGGAAGKESAMGETVGLGVVPPVDSRGWQDAMATAAVALNMPAAMRIDHPPRS